MLRKRSGFLPKLLGVAVALTAFLGVPSLSLGGGILEVNGVRLQVEASQKKEVIFDPTVQGCDANDITDVPLRMLRRADGSVVAYGSHYTTRLFHADAKGMLRRDCSIVMNSEKHADPTRFSDMTWLSAFWTLDGRVVYALGDNEYHAHKHPGECAFDAYQKCWYNTIVNAISFDGGNTFKRVTNSIPIAAAAFTHKAMQGEPRGFFTPTNIIERNGYFYTLIFTTGGGQQKRGNCLFRTRRLNVPEDWEFLTEAGFKPSAHNPYKAGGAPTPPPCKVLTIPGERIQSIVRHAGSGLYVMTMTRRATKSGPAGVYLMASGDLINWSTPVHVIHAPLRYNMDCKQPLALDYPSLIDPRSSDPNFQTAGDRPFIYATEIKYIQNGQKCESTMHRILTRYQVEISRVP